MAKNKKYKFNKSTAEADGVTTIDENQDGAPEAIEVDGQREEFVAEKPYVEGQERPKGYDVVEEDDTVETADESETTHEEVSVSPEVASPSATVEQPESAEQPASSQPTYEPAQETNVAAAEAPASPAPSSVQPEETVTLASATGTEETTSAGGVGVVTEDTVDVSPVAGENTAQQGETVVTPEKQLTETEAYAEAVKNRMDDYCKRMAPGVVQTTSTLTRNQFELFAIFQSVLNVDSMEKFEVGIRAIYRGFKENYALCFDHNRRFRGLVDMPVSMMKEEEVELLTNLIDLFCRLASTEDFALVGQTYRFVTIQNLIKDQFVLARFLSFIKRIVGAN